MSSHDLQEQCLLPTQPIFPAPHSNPYVYTVQASFLPAGCAVRGLGWRRRPGQGTAIALQAMPLAFETGSALWGSRRV